MDEAVRRWKQRGRIFFWFEPDARQGDGWHIAANASGCDDLDEVIRLSRAATFPARFRLAPEARQGAATYLTISINRSWPKEHWRIDGGNDPLFELGHDGLEMLAAAVADLRKGRGDYAIGPDEPDQRLWIWWPPR
jgi:hypothetical protein